jgi:hypothetical protein
VIESPPMSIQSAIYYFKLSAVILLGLFAILNPAWATTSEEKVTESYKKILSRANDLTQLAHSLGSGRDFDITMSIVDSTTSNPLCELYSINELLMIEPFVQDKYGKTMIERMISHHFDLLAKYVDLSVKMINISTPLLHNQAAVLAANKLRDDLRELKDLPKPAFP